MEEEDSDTDSDSDEDSEHSQEPTVRDAEGQGQNTLADSIDVEVGDAGATEKRLDDHDNGAGVPRRCLAIWAFGNES